MIRKLILIFTGVLFTWFVAHTTYVIYDGLTDDIKKADAIIVLGNKVEKTGEPSNRLKSRLDKAVQIYSKFPNIPIIVSGGTGKEGYDEAKVMKQYLIQNKVPAQLITEDNKGVNTTSTAQNAAKFEFLKPTNQKSVIIISQYFHITRSKLAFKKVGFNKVYSAHANYFELRDLYSIVREFFGYCSYLIR